MSLSLRCPSSSTPRRNCNATARLWLPFDGPHRAETVAIEIQLTNNIEVEMEKLLQPKARLFSRSKTADIERMLHISRPDTGMNVSPQSKSSSSTSSESKKYTKRRYTDSRHQTRHIPDADTLAGKTTASVASSSSVVMSSSSSTIGTQNQRAGAQPVWKRRELISSAPKDRERYF